MSEAALLRDFTRHFGHTLGRRILNTDAPFVYKALAYAVRDRLMDRWNQTASAAR